MRKRDFLKAATRLGFQGFCLCQIFNLAGAKWARHALPDTQEFMADRNITLTKEQLNIAKNIQGVKIVEADTVARNIYCVFNALTCMTQTKMRSPAMYVSNIDNGAWMGAPPVILVFPSGAKNSAETFVSIIGKRAASVTRGDDFIFKYIFFHEAGHAYLEQEQPEDAKNMPTSQSEQYADVFSIKSFDPGEREMVANFVVNIRSLNFSDIEHDTSFQVLEYMNGKTVPAFNPSEIRDSAEIFYIWGQLCSKIGDTKYKGLSTADHVRICEMELPKTGLEGTDKLVTMRRINFVVAYDNFYSNGNSAAGWSVSENEKSGADHAQPRP